MIELDDPVINLDLGLDEFVVLNALEVNTVRHLLLLDVDRVLNLKVYGRTVGERIGTWQKLLRKYLTYEKLLAARQRDEVSMEDILIHDPITKAGIEGDEAKAIQSHGISTIIEFLKADIDKLFPEESTEKELRAAIVSHQQRLWNKQLLEKSIEESMLVDYAGGRSSHAEEPEKTVTAHEFLEEPVAQSGINPSELEVLEALEVATVRDFLDLDIGKIREVKGYSTHVYTRLEAWQKYLRKRLHWSNGA